MKNLASLLVLFSLPAHAADSVTPWTAGLERVSGNLELASVPKDKAVVLFWGSWCTICKEKMHSFLPTVEKNGTATVFTVNMDRGVERAKLSVEKEKITFPVFRDEDRDLVKELKVFGVPHWAVYRKEGSGKWALVDSQAGFEDAAVLKALQAK